MAECRLEDSHSDNSSLDFNIGLGIEDMETTVEAVTEGSVAVQQGKETVETGSGCSEQNMEGATASANTLPSGIDRLLQQHRNEIMFELRRLQLGDKPVTGQENRKNVEDFFRRSTDPEAARDVQEEHRPEEVVVEVRALVERRPVSSISANFRRELENRLRGSLGTAPAPPRRQSAPRPRAPEARSRTPEVRPRAAAAERTAAPHRQTVPRAPTVPTASAPEVRSGTPEVRPRRTLNVSSALHQVASALPAPPATLRPEAADSDSDWEDEAEMQTPPTSPRAEPTITPQLPPVGPEERARMWLRQQPAPGGVPGSLWDNLGQAYRDSIITDISELVQQQLVTSTLQGDFRQTLETHVGARVESTGTDGRRVQQVINSLPRMPAHMRNNFSDLGIGHGGHNDNLSDTMSVISATAAVTIPHTQSTAVMSREIGSLKAQMEELKNMMRLSFDLQLDIQRAIRQEVSAAVHAAIGSGSSAPVEGATAGSVGRPSQPANSSKCVICLDKGADAVLYKCGHLCLCYTCGLTLRQRGGNCPVCRAPIQDIIRAYTVGSTD